MEDIIARPAPDRPGLLRRLMRPVLAPPADQLAPLPAPIRIPPSPRPEAVAVSDPDLESIYRRIERLERGTRLIVDTFKRAYAEMFGALDAIQEQSTQLATRTEVERIVTETAQRLTASAEKLGEAIDRFPHVLAAATAEVNERLTATQASVERALTALWAGARREQLRADAGDHPDGRPRVPDRRDPFSMPARASTRPLAARPFELEPVEQGFGSTPRR